MVGWKGSPSLLVELRVWQNCAVKAGRMEDCTRIRLVAVQIWPWLDIMLDVGGKGVRMGGV